MNDKLIQLSKQNEEYYRELNIFFDDVVQKSLSQWSKILSKKEYDLALKKNFFYNYIIKVGTNGYHDDEIGKKAFHDLFMSSVKEHYSSKMKFVYSDRFGFVAIEKHMPNSPFGRSKQDNISLKIVGERLVYIRDYSLLDGFGSKIKSFSQSLDYCLKNETILNITMNRRDIFNLFDVDGFVKYGMK